MRLKIKETSSNQTRKSPTLARDLYARKMITNQDSLFGACDRYLCAWAYK